MNLETLNLVELTTKESELFSGGESGWYWVTYAVGGFLRACYEMGVSAKGNPHI